MPKKTKDAPSTDADSQPLTQIQELYRYMVEQRLEALDYDHQGLRIRLVRQKSAPVHVPVAVPMVGAAAATPAAAPTAASSLPPGTVTIKAPMMGIFYRASTPSSPPFVKTGDSVKKGHVLCLIEAMKVFNEVKAEFDCVIQNALLDNGKPVKAGQDLYIVQKS